MTAPLDDPGARKPDEVRYASRELDRLASTLKDDSGGAATLIVLSGTSKEQKAIAAEAIAKPSGLDLFRIDLGQVIGKYIGETEKNLDRLFEEASRTGAVLFFDESDALFGKRADVKDSHDRYANIEVSYLLKRIEDHDGVVLLASNFPDAATVVTKGLRRARVVVVR